MEIWSRTICCLMNNSNGIIHIQIGDGKRSMPLWSVARKGRCYCRLVLRLQERKDVDQP
jgi:hypothetical protein